jgi:hypothetical protein
MRYDFVVVYSFFVRHVADAFEHNCIIADVQIWRYG